VVDVNKALYLNQLRCSRSSVTYEHTGTQPPIQNPDTLSRLLDGNRHSPEIPTSINKPLRIIADSWRRKAMEAIMLMMDVKTITLLIEMSVRMLLGFDSVVNDSYFLLDVCCEAVKRGLGVLKERHFECYVEMVGA
jgi:hypothetical protein